MKRSKYLEIGTISHGTLNPNDLISTYMDTLKGLHLTKVERLKLRRISIPVKGDAIEAYENDGQQEWDLESLIDMLENHCPPMCYFGSTEGDGSDFGCWPILDNEDTPKVSDPSELDNHKVYGAAYCINDHGNVTYYKYCGNSWVEVWSVV